MATFYVVCNDCDKKLAKLLKKHKRERTKDEFEELVLFETAHPIEATEEEIAEAMVCPRCNSKDCEKTFYGYGNMVMYTRGNGYLDKAGCQRDMNLYKLTTDDPYAHMRVAGEVDEMKVKFKRAGQHNPNTKHVAVGSGEMEKAVQESVSDTTASSD